MVPRLEGPARALARGELIGLDTRVATSTDAGLVGLQGRIVDETLRTFTIRRADGRESKVGKVGNVFAFPSPQGEVHVDGSAIEFRPADRTKKVR